MTKNQTKPKIAKKKQQKKRRIGNRNRLRALDLNQPHAPGEVVGLMNEMNIKPPQVGSLPPQLAFALAAMRPGEFMTPYVESAGNVANMPTGTAKGYFTYTKDTWGAELFHMWVLYSSISDVLGDGGLAHSDVATESTVIGYDQLIVGNASRDTVYGDTTNFTDKFFSYGTTAKCIMRAPAATFAGVAFVAQVTMAQAIATFRISDVLKHAIEIDLKTSPEIELRSFIGDLDMPHRRLSAKEDVRDEFFTLLIVPKAPAINIGSGTPMPVTFEWSLKTSYLWWPDYRTPALDSIVADQMSNPVVRPTSNQQAAIDTLSRVMSTPVPPSPEAFSALIEWACNSRSTRLPLSFRSSRKRYIRQDLNPYQTAPSLKGTHLEGWSDFLAWGRSSYSAASSAMPVILDWLKQTALVVVKETVKAGVMALLADPHVPKIVDVRPQADYFRSTLSKMATVIDLNCLCPDLISKLEQVENSIEEFVTRADTETRIRETYQLFVQKLDSHLSRRNEIIWTDSEGRQVNLPAEYERIRAEILRETCRTSDLRENSVESKASFRNVRK